MKTRWGGGTKSRILTNIGKDLWEYCMERKITLTAEHLPGSLNQTADWESRNVSTMSTNSWRLNPKIFAQINSGSSRDGPVCGQIKCTAREVHELKTRPIC